MAIDATPGASANSYIDVADADTYFSERLYSDTWECAATGDKEKALKQATRQLDALEWKGEKNDSAASALRWPRHSVYDKDGDSLSESLIPQFLKDATCELALDLLVTDNTKTSSQDNAMIKSVKAGPVAVEFAVSEKADKKSLESNVVSLIEFYLDVEPYRILRA